LLAFCCSEGGLTFVEAPALAPPEVAIDLAAQQAAEAEILAASQVALPDEEDDEL
jgi:hypothetical protein